MAKVKTFKHRARQKSTGKFIFWDTSYNPDPAGDHAPVPANDLDDIVVIKVYEVER